MTTRRRRPWSAARRGAAAAALPFMLSANAGGVARYARNADEGRQVVARADRFDFRNEFWYNLDHFLYHVARARRQPATSDAPAVAAVRSDTIGYGALPPSERAGWERALSYYDTARVPKPIGFDPELVATSFALAGRGSAPLSARDGLPPALVRALEDAAPAYRRLWWPRHAAANATFAARLSSLLTTHGDSVARQLTRIYRVPWPQTPPVVEVVAYANWAGAYTLVHPTVITVSSLFRGHDGTLGLEMLFHEQSHAMTDSVSAAIAAAGLAPTSRAASEIEHWIIFYTAGEVVRRTVAGHTPFADWRGLWKLPGFDRGYALLTAAWQPYLDGRQAFAAAVAQLVAGHQ